MAGIEGIRVTNSRASKDVTLGKWPKPAARPVPDFSYASGSRGGVQCRRRFSGLRDRRCFRGVLKRPSAGDGRFGSAMSPVIEGSVALARNRLEHLGFLALRRFPPSDFPSMRAFAESALRGLKPTCSARKSARPAPHPCGLPFAPIRRVIRGAVGRLGHMAIARGAFPCHAGRVWACDAPGRARVPRMERQTAKGRCIGCGAQATPVLRMWGAPS